MPNSKPQSQLSCRPGQETVDKLNAIADFYECSIVDAVRFCVNLVYSHVERGEKTDKNVVAPNQEKFKEPA